MNDLIAAAFIVPVSGSDARVVTAAMKELERVEAELAAANKTMAQWNEAADRTRETLMHREKMMIRCSMGDETAIRWVKRWCQDKSSEGGYCVYQDAWTA